MGGGTTTYGSEQAYLYDNVRELVNTDLQKEKPAEVLKNLAGYALQCLPYETSIFPKKRKAERVFRNKIEEYLDECDPTTEDLEDVFAHAYLEMTNICIEKGYIESNDTFDDSLTAPPYSDSMKGLAAVRRRSRMGRFMTNAFSCYAEDFSLEKVAERIAILLKNPSIN